MGTAEFIAWGGLLLGLLSLALGAMGFLQMEEIRQGIGLLLQR
jgi:hypothetical protein